MGNYTENLIDKCIWMRYESHNIETDHSHFSSFIYKLRPYAIKADYKN